MNGSVGVAFGAGMLATVSPCGLAMLPGFLAYYIGTDGAATEGGRSGAQVLQRSLRALRTGLVVSLGFVAVFVVAALVVTVGLRSVLDAVPWIAVAVGVVLVGAGLVMLSGRRMGVSLRFNPLRNDGRGPIAMLSYGAAYAVASLSCSLGVLLALVGGSLSVSTTMSLLRVLTSFAAGSATILVLLALSAGLASGGLVRMLQQSSRYVSRVAGGIVVLSGLYMVVYWVPALGGGSNNRTLAGKVMPTTGATHDLLEAHTGSLGLLAVAAILVIVALAVRSSRRVDDETAAEEPAVAQELSSAP